MEIEQAADLESLSDADLARRIEELTHREKAISTERRILHRYLKLFGVDRATQTTGLPLDGWLGALAARENEISFERSQTQARLDMLKQSQDARAEWRHPPLDELRAARKSAVAQPASERPAAGPANGLGRPWGNPWFPHGPPPWAFACRPVPSGLSPGKARLRPRWVGVLPWAIVDVSPRSSVDRAAVS